MTFIPINTPLFIGNEKKYLNECIDTGWVSATGPFVDRFERDMAKRFQRKNAISVSNATIALEIALRALDIKEGDEVIVPTLTIISCGNAIINNGATPVLCDVCFDTWNIDVSLIEKKITSKTKAIMMVHLYGLPCDIDSILKIAQKHNLKVIEDAAEVHGQTYNGKPCGSFGDVSVFSFFANKNMTTGEGGMILCDDSDLAERIFHLKNLCFMEGRRFKHDGIGYNARMTNVQAAIGLAQLECLDEFVQKKKEMGRFYQEKLSYLDGVNLPIAKTEFASNIYWVFGLVLDSKIYPNIEVVLEALRSEGIDCRPFFWPLHLQPIYKKLGYFSKDSHPVAEYLANNGFYIPSGLSLTKEQLNIVVEKTSFILEKVKNK